MTSTRTAFLFVAALLLVFGALALGLGFVIARYQVPLPCPPVASAQKKPIRPLVDLVPVTVQEVYLFSQKSAARGGAFVVFLRHQKRRVPLWIGRREALTISLALRKQKTPRPLTTHLLLSLLSSFQGKLVGGYIDSLQEGTFLGQIAIRNKGKLFYLDARPSDTIALALYGRAPLFMSRAILRQKQISPSLFRRLTPHKIGPLSRPSPSSQGPL